MRWVWMLLLVAACAGGTAEGPDGKGEEGEKKKPDPAVVVELATVGAGTVTEALLASGAVEAMASADLVPAATGRVLSVEHDVGDVVDKGELLAVIDNEVLDVGVQRARDDVRTLEARVEELRRLAAAGAVPTREVEDLEAQLRTSRAGLKEVSANAREARVVAPFSGVVAARDIKVGEMASAGKRAFQVVDLSSLRVTAQLPERDVSKLRLGQPAVVSSAYDEAQRASATVSRIAPVIDPNSGTFQVVLAVDASSGLRPGQFVNVSLEVRKLDGVMVVPRTAVVYDNGRPVVYRVKDAPPDVEEDKEADEQPSWWASLFSGSEEADDEEADDEEDPGPRRVAERVFVQLGLLDVAQAEIAGGLALGDRVVVVGQANLKDGSAIREPAPAAEVVKPAEPAADVPVGEEAGGGGAAGEAG